MALSLYDIKRCIRGEYNDADVWVALVRNPKSDEMWEKAQQQVYEEDYLDAAVEKNTQFRSLIHQSLTFQAYIPPAVLPLTLHSMLKIEEIWSELRSEASDGREQHALSWNAVRVFSIAAAKRVQFPSNTTIRYYTKDTQGDLFGANWTMDAADGDVLFQIQDTQNRMCLCLLTTESLSSTP